MIYPELKTLMERVDSRYSLVVQVAKRARQLVAGDEPLVDMDSSKSVTVAIQEVAEGKIGYRRTKDGIK